MREERFSMQYERFDNTIVVRLDRGDEIKESLYRIAKQEEIFLATVMGIGATDQVELAFFDSASQTYNTKTYNEPLEIVSLTGNITSKNYDPYLHLHIALGKQNYEVIGGHLNKAIISVTCELFIQIIEADVERKLDENIGINLMQF